MLCEAGKDMGVRPAGLRALSSLRLEKGYRDFGHDMDNTDTLLSMGLGFTANFDKPEPFVGQEAVLAEKE
jgi:4-methylaminobutanoate oxidase (formaldehyde-forming)